MTAPTFRPIGSTAFEDDTPLHAEGGRRIVRDTLAVLNERAVQIGNPYQQANGAGDAIRTLWRWCANWGYIGPWSVFVPAQIAERQGTIRMLVRMRTNGGNGNVRVYGIGANRPNEATMNGNTAAAPAGDAAAYVAESDSSTTLFEFALAVPVVAGWNEVYLAIKCDEDVDRAAAVTDIAPGRFVQRTITPSIFRSGVPALQVAGSQTTYYGAAIQASPDSTLFGVGDFDTFTVPYDAEPIGNERSIVVWEQGVTSWVSNPNRYGYVRAYFVTVAHIDAVSFDGSCNYDLESREFGPAFRYLQLASGALAFSSVSEAQRSHFARLPMTSIGSELGGSIATAVDRDNGYPAFYQSFAILRTSATFIPFRRVCLGIAKPTPDLDLQETFSGEYTWEARVPVFVAATVPQTAPTPLDFRLRILDGSGAEVAVSEVVTVVFTPVVFSRGVFGNDDQLAQQVAAWGSRAYMAEGMFTGIDVGRVTGVTIRVTGTSLDVTEVQRAVLEIRFSPPGQSGFVFVLAGPLATRLIDAG